MNDVVILAIAVGFAFSSWLLLVLSDWLLGGKQ